jgi:perosamine synthetase
MRVPWAIPNISSEDVQYVKDILDSGWYTMGKVVKLLEERMGRYVQRKHAIAVNNGTSALEVLLRTLDVSSGDEVIVPAFSYIASATSVSLLGATPVFVDVDKTMTIDPTKVEEAISKKTKAIMAVDLCGCPCDYDALARICYDHDVELIVDGAQSLGSTYRDKSCISYGRMATTSFHAAKILTTVEGGMVFTNDDDLAEKARALRNQGESNVKYVHTYLGGNFRMTNISAGFAIPQLERYEKTLKERRAKVALYKQLLDSLVETVVIRKEGKSCNFIFPIFYEQRDRLAEYLKEQGIDTRKIYPMTIPQQPIYRSSKKYPVSEWFCQRTLSLPLYAALTSGQIEFVCEKIKEFCIS